MDKKEFVKYLNQAYPKTEIVKIAQHIFNVIDKDDTGKIEFAEFAVVHHTLKEKSGNEKLKEIFRVFDANNDGHINAKEMKRLIKDLYSLLKHDNPQLAAEKVILGSTFSEMDEDTDGNISEQEFIKAVLEEAELTTLLTEEIDNVLLM